MLARGRGRILNVGSVAGFQPGPLMAVYYATKAFVNSLSEALSNEVAGTGVTVTCLAPGPTASEFDTAAGMAPRTDGVADARSVAEAGVRGMMRGKRLVVTGLRNKLLIFAERFLPRGTVIRAVRRLQEKRRTSL
jgi:short-subunit dehydrogenase